MGRGGEDPTGMGLRALGCLLLVCKSFLPRETKPSLGPSLPWPGPCCLTLSSPRPRNFLKEWCIPQSLLLFSLCPSSILFTSPAPHTPPAPDPRPTVLWPMPGLSRHHCLPSCTSQKTELSLRTSFSISRVSWTPQIL